MSKKTKIILIVVTIMLAVAILVYAGFLAYGIMAFFGGSNVRDNNDPKMQQEMLKTTQEWCRLAPVPDSKTNFELKPRAARSPGPSAAASICPMTIWKAGLPHRPACRTPR